MGVLDDEGIPGGPGVFSVRCPPLPRLRMRDSRDIVQRRWLAEQKATLHELAGEYGVSAERIRQLEKNAMKKLKKAIAA